MGTKGENVAYTPMEAFQIMVQYYTDIYLRSIQHDMGVGISTANLESGNFCSLDPFLLDDDDGKALYTGPSLAAALDHSVWDFREQKMHNFEAQKAHSFVVAPSVRNCPFWLCTCRVVGCMYEVFKLDVWVGFKALEASPR